MSGEAADQNNDGVTTKTADQVTTAALEQRAGEETSSTEHREIYNFSAVIDNAPKEVAARH